MEKCCYAAELENLVEVKQFVAAACNQDCAADCLFDILLCVDEIFTNIVHYGGGHDVMVTVSVSCSEQNVTLQFDDSGVPFDPVNVVDPDLDIPFSNREPGGLGLFMVKQLADDVVYTRFNGCNRLTISKNICFAQGKR